MVNAGTQVSNARSRTVSTEVPTTEPQYSSGSKEGRPSTRLLPGLVPGCTKSKLTFTGAAEPPGRRQSGCRTHQCSQDLSSNSAPVKWAQVWSEYLQSPHLHQDPVQKSYYRKLMPCQHQNIKHQDMTENALYLVSCKQVTPTSLWAALLHRTGYETLTNLKWVFSCDLMADTGHYILILPLRIWFSHTLRCTLNNWSQCSDS